MRLVDADNLLRTTYLDLISQESSKARKHRSGTTVSCHICGSSYRTLRRDGDKYICQQCYLERLKNGKN